ncbi:RimK/LysX family protein [Winogradskyella sp.]|nr:RimK/LysX family protein [Winogradskyella sp.]MDB9755043.1 RimK/LysX family protein [Winogradskyella sp.]MDB9781691.1 RimK/LysX family protein [Winogradskyella sp.]MDC0006457.1 RimK/LysX family protein [Winogradskyella sp.]MDC1503841.1 RimK/LysX family protein [Winogradskyella sp.]
MTKKVLGRVDKVNFPELKLNTIDVKIDTGAYTSCIHCSKIREEDNKLYCIFESKGHPNFKSEEIVFNTYTYTDVKSSNGHRENRFKIKTNVVFFGKTYKINLTLSTRDDMRFPVLIGRQFLSKKFIIDVDLENQSFNTQTKK